MMQVDLTAIPIISPYGDKMDKACIQYTICIAYIWSTLIQSERYRKCIKRSDGLFICFFFEVSEWDFTGIVLQLALVLCMVGSPLCGSHVLSD